MKRRTITCVLTVLCFSHILFGQTEKVSILPAPAHISESSGTYTLKNGIKIGVSNKSLLPAALYLQSILQGSVTSKVITGKGDICLQLENGAQKEGAYSLQVNAKNIVAKSSSYSGIIAAISTIHQLLPVESVQKTKKGVQIPLVNIKDEPRFAWRGLMLDASRHFWNKEEVKRVLDMMTLYKLNKFHWHLTDDQGWRIEIKKYPLLTEKGAWRTFNSQDKECMRLATEQNNPDFLIPENKLKVAGKDTLYGGFYTQEDIKEIVAYASQRGIEVIPEIDMPGHFLAAISQYPDVACTGLIGWGQTFSSPICPGKDSSLEFCKNIYKEVFALFPSKYVHLGADEVEKSNWKKCQDCQNRIKKEGLASEEALQAWFVRNMEQFFKENGKRMIGWDEVVGDGLSKDAVIMWWRSWEKGAVPSALAQGKNVVLSPNACFYFDYQQDKNSLKSILEFDPMSNATDIAQQNLIMGVQANIWTEYIPSMKRVEYMIVPRMIALSQVAWGNKASKMSTADFMKALASQMSRLDKMNVNYRIPDLDGFYNVNAFVNEGHLNISCPLPGLEVRYTTDGTVPTKSSPLYKGDLKVTETTNFMLRSFRPDGTGCDVVNTKFIKEPYLEADATASPQENGLLAIWHDFRGNKCADITNAPKKGEYTVDNISIPSEVKGNIGLVLKGYLQIPQDDIYTFALTSDDGSIFSIDGNTVIDNDGPHSPREVIAQKALKKGLHPIEIRYFDSNGGMLQMCLINKNGEKTILSKDWFKH